MSSVRQLRVCGDIAIVTLTKGYEAIVDASDIGVVSGRNWSALVCSRRKAVYACRTEVQDGRSKMILMHRAIACPPDKMQVDHIDGDGLNCRRDNLRICTHAQNQMNKAMRSDNRSGFKGVGFDPRVGLWKAEICLNKRRKWLGHFKSPEEAHAAYIAAALETHGDFARPQ